MMMRPMVNNVETPVFLSWPSTAPKPLELTTNNCEVAQIPEKDT